MQSIIQKYKTLRKDMLNKIEDNENLTIQVNELKSAHRYTTELFEKKILDLKAQLTKNVEVISGTKLSS